MPRSKQVLNNCQSRCEDYFWQLYWCLATQDFEKLFKHLPESNRKKFNDEYVEQIRQWATEPSPSLSPN